MVEKSLWTRKVEANPGHSAWYVERFRSLAAAGADLNGEARFVDTMVGRGSRILDAGCGPGRVGGELARRGHTVVGVDVDPVLIEAARRDHPQVRWLVADLADLDRSALDLVQPFDAIVCAGHVMPFLAPATRGDVLVAMRALLASGGRAVIGFGSGRGYAFEDFFADAEAAGLESEVLLSSWDLRPFRPDSVFLVAILRTRQGAPGRTLNEAKP
ncbi:MAG: class I SAM-dependent methyltransferase [Candidatus Dormibacteraceae bacterium]